MKKLLTVASLAIIATAPALQAKADYQPQGIFGGRSTPDGAISVKQATGKQFNPVRGQSVADRPRPDFAPTPIDLGSFQLFPTMAVGAYHDSNIYATDTNRKGDMVGKVNPAASLVSNWGRHALAFTGIGDINVFNNNSSENNYNGALQVDGRYDVAAKTWLSADASIQKASEPRSNPSSPASLDEPISFNLAKMGVGAHRSAGLLSADIGYDAKIYDYKSADLTGGGKLELNGRDRTQHLVNGELGYDMTGNFKPFVSAEYDQRDYHTNDVRGSDGFRIDLGTRADFGLVTAKAYVGYLDHNYDHFANGDINTMDFGGDVTWNITTLTSIEAEVARTVEETTVGGIAVPTAAAGYLSTGGSVTVTHELMRNVLIEAHTSYAGNQYENSGRDDDVYGAGVGSRYYMNRHMYLDGTYDYTDRNSNVAGGDFKKHVIFARIGAQY